MRPAKRALPVSCRRLKAHGISPAATGETYIDSSKKLKEYLEAIFVRINIRQTCEAATEVNSLRASTFLGNDVGFPDLGLTVAPTSYRDSLGYRYDIKILFHSFSWASFFLC